jgi:hypothetical protein
MGIVYMLILWFAIPFQRFIPLALLSLCTIAGFASFGYLVNDLFDIKQDVLSGKTNFLAGKSLGFITILFLSSFCVIFCPWFFLPANALSFLLIALQLSLFIIYSVPPFRLKERGIAGIVIDSLYAHALPPVLAAYTFSLAANKPFPGPELVFLFAWQFSGGIRNILLHQAEDIPADKKSGAKNFAATMSYPGLMFALKYLIIAEIFFCLAFLLLLSLSNPFFGPCILTVLGIAAIASSLFNKHGVEDMLRSKWKYFPNNLYEKWLPLLFLSLLCISDKLFISVLVLHIVLFNLQLLENVYQAAKSLLVMAADDIFAAGSVIVNYAIYYGLRLFGINLKKERSSAIAYFKKQWGKKSE